MDDAMDDDGSPLITAAKDVYTRFSNAMKMIPGKGAPPQTVQHADPGMVEEANESFRKAVAKPMPVQTKPILKPAPRKR